MCNNEKYEKVGEYSPPGSYIRSAMRPANTLLYMHTHICSWWIVSVLQLLMFSDVSKLLEDEQKQMTEWEARQTFTDSFMGAAEVKYM